MISAAAGNDDTLCHAQMSLVSPEMDKNCPGTAGNSRAGGISR